MDRHFPISFDLRKYVANHYSGYSTCTTKRKNKASYKTAYIVSDLIEFFSND